MKPRSDGKLTLSFNAKAEIRDWLRTRAAELTIKQNKRVSMGEVLNQIINDYQKKIKK